MSTTSSPSDNNASEAEATLPVMSDNKTQVLSWKNVSLSTKGKGEKSGIQVLKGMSGTVRAGEISCVIGPSGAGKTSFFNVLTGHLAGSKAMNINGQFILDKHKVDPSSIEHRHRFAYAIDGDPVDQMATPRETIYLSAKLRLPRGTTEEKINETVESILDILHLHKVADKLIGRGRGLSAGERRRVSLGRELVVSPDIIVLDEATSGESHRVVE